eukprot:5076322-Prorocentrum_lima.AAC.1
MEKGENLSRNPSLPSLPLGATAAKRSISRHSLVSRSGAYALGHACLQLAGGSWPARPGRPQVRAANLQSNPR